MLDNTGSGPDPDSEIKECQRIVKIAIELIAVSVACACVCPTLTLSYINIKGDTQYTSFVSLPKYILSLCSLTSSRQIRIYRFRSLLLLYLSSTIQKDCFDDRGFKNRKLLKTTVSIEMYAVVLLFFMSRILKKIIIMKKHFFFFFFLSVF